MIIMSKLNRNSICYLSVKQRASPCRNGGVTIHIWRPRMRKDNCKKKFEALLYTVVLHKIPTRGVTNTNSTDPNTSGGHTL